MPITDGDLKRMERDVARTASLIKSATNALVISHIDADGITAGSIASITLDRLGIPRKTLFVNKMDDETINLVNKSSENIVWICDLGSGYASQFTRPNIVITDHHIPDTGKRSKKTQMLLDDFSEEYHINPHCYGMDGSYEVCGAGMTYIVSRAIDSKNIDLAYLAVIGACGDFQDNGHSKLVSFNRTILDDAVLEEDVVPEFDVRLFGRETRTLINFIQYCNDPNLSGITENYQGCLKFYDSLNIPLKDGNKSRVWNDLSVSEKERATDKIISIASDENRAVGEVYTLPKFEKYTGLRDAKEFATILNSCGRYEDAETGMRLCYGDMNALKDAEENRSEHRRQISSALSYVKQNHLIRRRKYIQYFDAGTQIRETVVGIVAGMMLTSGDAEEGLPMFAFADADDGVKVSARADRNLVNRGLNLSVVMNKAASLVGGAGGGHTIAAGATIPPEKKEEFLNIVEDLVSAQII